MSAKPRIPILARFQNQLILLILLVITPSLSLFVYGHFEQQRIELQRTRDGAEALSNLAATIELSLIKQARQLLATLSELPFLVLTKDSNFAKTHLSNLEKLLPDYVNFGIIETNGNLFCSASPLETRAKIIRDPWVRQVIDTKKFAIGDQARDLMTNPAGLTIGFPVLDTNRNVLRVIFATLNQSLFAGALNQIHLPDGALLMVVDAQGSPIARRQNTDTVAARPGPTFVNEILSRTNQVFQTADRNGEQQLVALSKIADGKTSKLFIAASIPFNISLKRIHAMLARNVLILSAVSAAILLAARAFSQRFLVFPIQKLIIAADRLAEGDLSARTGITKGSTELNHLAMRFDFMAVALMNRQFEIEGQKREISKMNSDLEKRVLERTERLAFMNRELEAFSYSVSHDLRAPIRHMDGFADLLQKHSGSLLDEKGTRYLRMIRESSRRMGTLIDDLLLFSRIGREELHKARFSMSQLVEETVVTLRPDLEGRSIEWNIEPLPEVYGDRGMFRQVWLNLIGNAIKYTKPRETATITIGSKVEERGELTFFIRDNGVGFDMKYVDKLFSVFQRLHSESEFEGTGVGLANVRRIVDRHEGRTWAEADVEKGATFYFTMRESKNEAAAGINQTT